MNKKDLQMFESQAKLNKKNFLDRFIVSEVVYYSEADKKITLNIDGFHVSKNISISQHLLNGYTRDFDIEIDFDEMEQQYTASETTLNGSGPHQHTFISSSSTGNMKGTGSISWNKDALKTGDFVKVFVSSEEKKFFVSDKFINFS